MKMRKFLLILSIMFLFCFLWACGGSDGDSSSSTESTTNSISGVASKGLISEGTVKAYAITSEGEKGELLGTTTTDGEGHYSLDLEYDDAVIVEVTGGTYTDEATGQSTELSSTLRAALPSVTVDTTAAVTPLSEMAVRVAETSGSITATKIEDANGYISQLLDADIISTLPVDCSNADDFSTASEEAQNYTLLLASISQMAETSNDNISGVLDTIEADLRDDAEMNDTSDEMLTAINDFLASDKNQTGRDNASDLVENIEGVVEDGFEITYSIEGIFLQYRNYEKSSKNSYRYLVILNKNGLPVTEEEISSITIADADGNLLTESKSGYTYEPCYSTDFRIATPILTDLLYESDLWGAFESLDAGTYQVDILMANGDHLTETVSYPGQLVLPVIQSSTMASEWSDGALVLSWTNPTSEANWSDVDQIRILLFDTENEVLLRVKLDPTADTVTLPAAMINSIMSARNTGLASWQIQARTHDDDGINYARSVSNAQSLSYAIGCSALNYRTYEDESENLYNTWVDVFSGGEVAAEGDFSNFKLLDSSGNEITPLADPSFWGSSFEFPVYDCTSGSCSQSVASMYSGIGAKYSDLSAGTYQMTVDSLGGTLTTQIDFSGAVSMPVIPSSSVGIEESIEGAWTLTWANPIDDDNWSKVDQIRFIFSVIYDEANIDEEVLIVKVSPEAETVTISSDVMSEVESIISESIGERSITEVRIETRAYEDNMNYARGVSFKDIEGE